MHALCSQISSVPHVQHTLQRDVNYEQAVRCVRPALVRHAHPAQHPRHITEQPRHLGAHTEGAMTSNIGHKNRNCTRLLKQLLKTCTQAPTCVS